ncbi:MAG TPA: arsenate reductase (glutaredoxin) [Frateuria sp.]|uniref:arsenate reductase (glutaredoxin) n=1 Tax=Frateuria sp. TaxID=2211372 RepID=UPI002DF0CC8C|nr:arsenate reductase (glutaredoxin) [Frateuria sp.]HEV2540432.1 arsenate reductase (glutaredoxin) [Frateuria sp.]
MSVRIYHNSRCSKSRGTLELLQARGIEPEVVNYLDTPPSVGELKALLRLLGLTPRQLLRTGEAEYAQLGLADPTVDDEAILQAMTTHPKLIERPIVVTDGKAAIGRPPEAALAILP